RGAGRFHARIGGPGGEEASAHGWPRTDRIHANTRLAHFQRQAARVVDDRRLGARVYHLGRDSHLTVEGADVDDDAFAPRSHARNDASAHEERTHEVARHDRTRVFDLDVESAVGVRLASGHRDVATRAIDQDRD